ncbi:HAMP domain-containing sensor histidine kinase [uncultured Thiodictyon sp.]|uniref:sensor histidine kinase n=1 Tax=uncultured Thiodictyon sp. TaxID=1846217 RepID=UPI0025D1027E|nr:HAMP domain-containing sensor histidine kinase [uncultured Thiodictyon sp.]
MTASGIPPTLTPLAAADVITRLESLLGCCDAPETLRTQLRQLIAEARASMDHPPRRSAGPAQDTLEPPGAQPSAPCGQQLRALPATRLAQCAGRHTAGALIAVLPHELSQPLAAIAMYSNVASALLQSGTLAPDALADVMDRIQGQVKRAAEILARLRELVRSDGAEPSSTDLCQTLAEAVALIRPLAAHKQVQLFVDFPAEPVRLQVSKTVIGQIVLHLLFNSIEAIEQAGTAQRRVRLSVHPEPMGVQVTVQDSGPGIRPEDAERIFKAFESDKSAGCGLGLAISRALIEPLGGHLWVDPRVTDGATLHLRLPRSAHTEADQ